MSAAPHTRTAAEIAAELAMLRAELDGLPPLLTEAEAALAATEAPLAEARAVCAAAGEARGATLYQSDLAAEEAFTEAERALSAALVTRNTADARRGALRGRQRYLVARAEQLEGELARAQQAAERNPNRLAGIRERLFGGAGG